MIDILFSLVLILLGALAAHEFLNQKIKPVGRLVTMLEPYAPLVGLIGLFAGIIWLFETLGLLRHFTYYPLATLLLWVYSMLMLSLGLIFGQDVISKIVGEPSPSYIVRIGEWRRALLPYQTKLGLAAMVLGFAFILYIV